MKTYISLFVIVLTFGCFSYDYELPEITEATYKYLKTSFKFGKQLSNE